MARPEYGPSVQQQVTISFDMLGGSALAALAAHTLVKRMPFKAKLVGVTLNVGLRGGTHVTSTVDVRNGATSLLAAVFDVAALTPGTPVDKEGTALAAAAESIAKDSALTVVVAEASGTSPTWADVTLQLDFVKVV